MPKESKAIMRTNAKCAIANIRLFNFLKIFLSGLSCGKSLYLIDKMTVFYYCETLKCKTA